MIEPLTPNTQAILLLTAPLIAGQRDNSRDLLSLSDYNRAARVLREKQLQPADLIGADAKETAQLLAPLFGRERIEALACPRVSLEPSSGKMGRPCNLGR